MNQEPKYMPGILFYTPMVKPRGKYAWQSWEFKWYVTRQEWLWCHKGFVGEGTLQTAIKKGWVKPWQVLNDGLLAAPKWPDGAVDKPVQKP